MCVFFIIPIRTGCCDPVSYTHLDVYKRQYFYIFAAMGLVCAVLAFFLFRRREMERSGDVVAIRALRPVFLCLFSLGCALVIGYLLAMFVSLSLIHI